MSSQSAYTLYTIHISVLESDINGRMYVPPRLISAVYKLTPKLAQSYFNSRYVVRFQVHIFIHMSVLKSHKNRGGHMHTPKASQQCANSSKVHVSFCLLIIVTSSCYIPRVYTMAHTHTHTTNLTMYRPYNHTANNVWVFFLLV